jgi:hypothetical protein
VYSSPSVSDSPSAINVPSGAMITSTLSAATTAPAPSTNSLSIGPIVTPISSTQRSLSVRSGGSPISDSSTWGGSSSRRPAATSGRSQRVPLNWSRTESFQ